MAVIKIKNIKTNLQAVLNYGKNGEKTEHGILVSSINCNVDTAYEEMALTKKFFHKEGKTLGYHIIQSFKGNNKLIEDYEKILIGMADNNKDKTMYKRLHDAKINVMVDYAQGIKNIDAELSGKFEDYRYELENENGTTNVGDISTSHSIETEGNHGANKKLSLESSNGNIDVRFAG